MRSLSRAPTPSIYTRGDLLFFTYSVRIHVPMRADGLFILLRAMVRARGEFVSLRCVTAAAAEGLRIDFFFSTNLGLRLLKCECKFEKFIYARTRGFVK